MPGLLELQHGFYAALMTPEVAEAGFLVHLREDPAVARQRLGVHRRNVYGALTNALRASYPVIEKLVGEAFFRHLAEAYIAVQPSLSGDLNEFGDALAGFLPSFPPAAGLPYLADMARLEWRVQQLYFAADPPAADLSALAAATPARWEGAVFEFQEAQARLDSAWPLADIWRVNQPDYSGDMEVAAAPCAALVWRRGDQVEVAALAVGEARFFDALAQGAPLAAAVALAAADPAFELEAVLARLFARGLIRSVIC